MEPPQQHARTSDTVGDSGTPTEVTEILRKRARALARPLDLPTSTAVAERAMLIFARGDEQYALEVEEVSEVLPLGNLTPVPRTPATITGVMNLRGRILPIIDVRPVYALPSHEPALGRPIIVVNAVGTFIGLIADEIIGVSRFPRETERPTEGIARGYVGEAIVVLDLAAILRDPRIKVDVTPRKEA